MNPITTNVLQFAVGTANIGATGTIGLNTVVTLRQANGLDGTLNNQPVITGPAGFVNTGVNTNGTTCLTSPAPGVQSTTGVGGPVGAGLDSGTNLISGSPQVNPVGGNALCTTLGVSGGAFGYGFQPANSTTAAGVSFTRYSLPFYTSATIFPYIGGPPAFPQVRDGTFPNGFQGYPMGFTDFNTPPVAGVYNLNVRIPTGFDANNNATFGNIATNATLATTVALPAFATPTFTKDGVGGLSITVTVPAGVTEAYVIVRDSSGACYPGSQPAPAYYTLRTTTVGAQTLVLAPNLGPTGPGSTANTRSICTGDSFRIYAVGFNYGANAAAYPFSSSQTPALVGANGQVDITTSPFTATQVY